MTPINSNVLDSTLDTRMTYVYRHGYPKLRNNQAYNTELDILSKATLLIISIILRLDETHC